MKATATLTGVLPAMLLGCLTLAAAAEYVSMGDQLPTATLDVGEVIGTTTTLPSSTSVVNKFLGIPFAASPPERFSPPVPVGKFQNPYIAQAWGPACIQQFNCGSSFYTMPSPRGHDSDDIPTQIRNLLAPLSATCSVRTWRGKAKIVYTSTYMHLQPKGNLRL